MNRSVQKIVVPFVFLLLILALLPLVSQQKTASAPPRPVSEAPVQTTLPRPVPAAVPSTPVYQPQSSGVIENAFRARSSAVPVVEAGTVSRLLPDDNHGSRHQRFIVTLSSGHTILIAHNIDLAPRVNALREGDFITFAGVFEWNEKGGVVHWTHHDPRGRRAGGYLLHNGVYYR